MKPQYLFWSLLALFAAMLIAGCGGGSSTVAAPSRSVTGQALAPASLAGRASDPDVPVPSATVTLLDITSGLPGTTIFTSSTDHLGHYHFTGLTADHIYLVVITKQVTDSTGHPVTLSLSVVAPPADSKGQATADVTPGTTVAVGYILSQLADLKGNAADAAHALENIARTADDIAKATDAARKDGTAPEIDLTKPATDPASHSDEGGHIAAQALKSASFLAPDGNAKGTVVDMIYDKTTNQAFVTLFIRDSAGDVFDTDTFVGSVDSHGAFGGKTIDGGYTVMGNLTPGHAQGTWASADGATKGSWKADRSGEGSRSDGAQGVAYRGTFRGPNNDEKGGWFMYVDKSGSVLIAGHSSKADRIHLKSSIVLTGTIDSSSAISAKLAFPAEGGTLTGSDPTVGTAIVTANSHASGFYGSLHGTITGSTSGSTVSGTWQLKGSADPDTFDEAGTWSGTKY